MYHPINGTIVPIICIETKFNFNCNHPFILFHFILVSNTAIPEGFSVNVYPSENPLEQDKVSLCCSADNYTYEQLRWYRLDPHALRGKPQELDCRSVHLYAVALDGQLIFQEASNSWVLDYTLPAIQLQDEGHYACEAQSRRSGERHCLFRYLSVKGEGQKRWSRQTQPFLCDIPR